jgi:hypothetical protein
VVAEAALHVALSPPAARARVPARLEDANLATAGAGLLRLGVPVRAARPGGATPGLIVAGTGTARLALVLAQLGLEQALRLEPAGDEALLSGAAGAGAGSLGALGRMLLAEDPIAASLPPPAAPGTAAPGARMSADEALRRVARLRDDADQLVDPGIRLALAGLIRMGIRTENSCEGHLVHGVSSPPQIEFNAADAPAVRTLVERAGLGRELVLVPEDAAPLTALFPRAWHAEAMRLLEPLQALRSPTWLPLGRRLAETGDLGGADEEEAERVARAADRLNALGRDHLGDWQGSFRRLGLALLAG